ncbi:MAG: Gfo/Idh/MocA family oxidoreductase [Candidatus Thiodiazotropha sp.]
MSTDKIRIGIVGLKPGESWAGIAHVPALQSMPETFAITGVANSRLESSRLAAEAVGIPHAFANAQALIDSPEIDAVTVTITVPQHLEVVKAALAAGKHIYCEAPLGNGLAEAEEMAALARDKPGVTVVGLQARVAPEILYLRELLSEGYVGRVLSSSLRGWAGNWGPTAGNLKRLGYLLDKRNGATMLTIPLAHTLAGLRDVLGDVTEVSALLDTRVPEVRSEDDGSLLRMTAPDQILLTARLESGAPLSVHFQGGMPNGTEGLVWDIHGTDGDLRVTAPLRPQPDGATRHCRRQIRFRRAATDADAVSILRRCAGGAHSRQRGPQLRTYGAGHPHRQRECIELRRRSGPAAADRCDRTLGRNRFAHHPRGVEPPPADA